MTREEILTMKKEDVIGALNLATIMFTSNDGDLEHMIKDVERIVKCLNTELEALNSIDEFLRLQNLIIGND